jgi:hypothetical protein
MFLYKAWIETRARFLAGMIGVAILTAWDLRHPRFNSTWSFLGIHDYGCYLWRSLYDEGLQQIWALSAVVLAFGGLICEKTSGTVSFSLGLPVSRRCWLFTRLATVLMESVALSLCAALVIIVDSAAMHQTVSLSQVLLHTALIVAAGVFLIAFGNLCYSLFPGNYLSLLYTVILLGVPYAWIQLQMQRVRIYDAVCAARSCVPLSGLQSRLKYLAYLDIPHAMGGPWHLNGATIPWISLLVIWTLTALVLGVTVVYGDRIDY